MWALAALSVALPLRAAGIHVSLGGPARLLNAGAHTSTRGHASTDRHARQDPASRAAASTVGDFLHNQSEAANNLEVCLPELDAQVQKLGFAIDQQIWVDKQMKPGSRLFAIGDSVIGQLHALGKPGLSCSETRPCMGEPPFRVGVNKSWELELDKTVDAYRGKGWQHLKRYVVRSSQNTPSQVEGWEVSPAVVNNVSRIGESVALLQRYFDDEVKPTKDDVMLIGLLGNHFNDNLDAFDKYAQMLMKDIVNPFPGRVVILGSSPQHFKTDTGAYDTSLGQTRCAPAPKPSDVDVPINKHRMYVWGYNVWQHMKNKRARFVDMYELLHPLWRCHRNAQDCTHWQDPVISIQVQLVLEAMQKIA